MGKEINIVVLKPVPQSTKEYMVIINPDEYKKWKGGDKTIPLVQVVDGMLLFSSETGSQGRWLTPAAGEIAADFDNYNADGSVKEGMYDHTKRVEDHEDGEEDFGGHKGRKAKKVALETAIMIVLEHGREQTSKAIGTGGADNQISKGSGLTTGNINTSGR
ncbi:hypothetical protein QFC19_001529 [Naganishia cerealis]|uniref:Uncharacterized protein n=1 Tax=Naganishia cerealis TaxID=610337 RepID=A0ACC2WHQ8_9TREE|nr:hypothetical protein QFC19_001529 [Naganishia cerealis]